MDQKEKEKNLDFIQNKIVNIYKSDAEVNIKESHQGKIVTILIKEKTTTV